jgi:hypothetical protein
MAVAVDHAGHDAAAGGVYFTERDSRFAARSSIWADGDNPISLDQNVRGKGFGACAVYQVAP